MLSKWKKILPRRKQRSDGKEKVQLSAEARDDRSSLRLQQRNSELREAREDLLEVRGIVADGEAELAEAQGLLTAVEKETAELAGGKTLNDFYIEIKEMKEENYQLKEQLARVEDETLRIIVDNEAELKAEREERQHLEARLAVLQQVQQQPKNESWWRRLNGGKTRNQPEKLSIVTEAHGAKDALRQADCELREARADLGKAFPDIEVFEAQLAETRRLLWAARQERARLAGGTLVDQFWIIKQNTEEENRHLKEQLARPNGTADRLRFDYHMEIKKERQRKQELEVQLEDLQQRQQKSNTKSWLQRLGW